jgi:acetyltransferase-like isoleucine patch superfamily enzyme
MSIALYARCAVQFLLTGHPQSQTIHRSDFLQPSFFRERRVITEDVMLGEGVVIPQPDLVNLYGCRIGDGTKIGAFVEIQKGVRVGRQCKISSHSFLCEGVEIEDDVFIGHGVMFINDRYPRATAGGRLQTGADWKVIPTLVRRGASIGSGAVILCGVTIGEHALIGAGAVVTRDVPAEAVVMGVPARVHGYVPDREPPS